MGKNKILIVDDEPDFVVLLKRRLEANNYEVVTASNGDEGLQKIAKDKPNVILLDILMPGKDGYTMLQEMKTDESTRKIPVIVLTAKPYMRDLFALEGLQDYLVKPFEDDDLLLRIKRVLGS